MTAVIQVSEEACASFHPPSMEAPCKWVKLGSEGIKKYEPETNPNFLLKNKRFTNKTTVSCLLEKHPPCLHPVRDTGTLRRTHRTADLRLQGGSITFPDVFLLVLWLNY